MFMCLYVYIYIYYTRSVVMPIDNVAVTYIVVMGIDNVAVTYIFDSVTLLCELTTLPLR